MSGSTCRCGTRRALAVGVLIAAARLWRGTSEAFLWQQSCSRPDHVLARQKRNTALVQRRVDIGGYTKRTTREPDKLQYFEGEEEIWAAEGEYSEEEEEDDDDDFDSYEEDEDLKGYEMDDSPLDDAVPKSIGPVRYFGVSSPEGIKIFEEENSEEESAALYAGEVVAAEVPTDGTWGRLLDGRGWIHLDELDDGIEEVHPWAAKVLAKRITKEDANALAYLTMDEDAATDLNEHLPLPKRVIQNLEKRGIKKASPIQDAVFNEIYNGKSLCLQSQTGTGKTLAMALPVLTAMSEESEWGRHGDKMIIVAATRELAVQLYSEIDGMGWFPQGKGFATMCIVGNVPPDNALLKANVIIGTPNELGGMLHKNHTIIQQLNTKLRAVVLDEVDEYTSAPRFFASKFKIRKRRKQYMYKKRVLDWKMGDFNKGIIELFMKRTFNYCRRRDLQILAASATLGRNIKRKVYRLMRWDPLGRWYNNPPPLIRPKAMMEADWQATPFMPTISQDVKHRFVRIVKPRDESRGMEISDKHWTRKPYRLGGFALPPVKRTRNAGYRPKALEKGMGLPVSKLTAVGLLDGLHDALKCRGNGTSMVILCRTAGITVTDTLKKLQEWGFYEAEGLHEAIFTHPEDINSRKAMKFNYDMKDHANFLAGRHAELQERARSGVAAQHPVGSHAWRKISARTEFGETTSPIIIGFEGLARGIHFDGLKTVYIVGTPRTPQAYMHMAGRVGRLGQKGEAGKVVSIVPEKSPKQLDSWARKVGPKVRFEPEPITRIRSFGYDEELSEPSTRPLRQYRRQRFSEEEEETETEKRRETLLLPLPGERLAMPGFDDEEFEPEPVPRRRDRVAEAVHAQTGAQNTLHKRRMASHMQRAAHKWKGPDKRSKYIPKHKRWILEHGGQMSIDDPSKPA